jgi:hypothetical protein
VDEEDLLLLAGQVTDEAGEVGGHQGEVPLAQGDPIRGAVDDGDQPVERLRRAHDPRHAPHLEDRRVVGVHREAHARFLGHRHDRPQEVLEPVPQLLGVDAARRAAAAGASPRRRSRSRSHHRGARAVVSGGISADEAAGYFAAGAHAVCLGGALIDRDAARRGDVTAVAAKASRVMGQTAVGGQ